jgi:hypothetical protein
MTQDRRPNHAKPNRPPDRSGYAWAANASGASEQRPSRQSPAVPIVWWYGWRGEWLPTAARDVQTAHSQASRGHPTPIAPAAGERFSPIRFSLTGAAPDYGALSGRLVRRAAEQKTLFSIGYELCRIKTTILTRARSFTSVDS